MPRSAKVTVTVFNRARVGVGRSVNQHRMNNTDELPRYVADQLERTIREVNSSRFFRIAAPDLAMSIAKQIEKELKKVGQFITTQLIGHTSGRDRDGVTSIDKFPDSDIELDWRNLAPVTSKVKRAHKHKFFRETDALGTEIRAKVGPGLNALNEGPIGRTAKGFQYGPVAIRPSYFELEDRTRVYKIAEIHINLLRNTKLGIVGSFTNQTIFNEHQGYARGMPELARMLGLSPETIGKLEGGVVDRNRSNPRTQSGYEMGMTPQGRQFYRPLLEPAFAYFFQTRVPRAVEKVLTRFGQRAGGANRRGIVQ